jgi:uncharacterized membrane protein
LRSYSLQGDEPFSVFHALGGLGTIVDRLQSGNNPPLYECVLHFWTLIFGVSEFWVRLPSLLFVAGGFYFFVRTLQTIGKSYVVIGTLLFFSSSYIHQFACEARSYGMLIFFTQLWFFQWLKMILEPNAKVVHLLMGLTLAIAMYTHFFAAWLGIAQFLFVLMSPAHRGHIRKYLYSWLFTLLAYLPYVGVLFFRWFESAAHGTWIQPVTNMGSLHDFVLWVCNNNATLYALVVTILYSSIGLIQDQFEKKWVWYVLFFSGLFFLGFALSIHLPMPYYWEFTSTIESFFFYSVFLISVFFLVVTRRLIANTQVLHSFFLVSFISITMFLCSIKIPMFIDRYLVFIAPFLYLILTHLYSLIWKKGGRFLVVFILFLMFLGSHRKVEERRAVRELTSTILACRNGKHEPVVLCPYFFDYNLMYYLDRDLFVRLGKSGISEQSFIEELNKENVWPVAGLKQVPDSILNTSLNVVYVNTSADFAFPHNGIEDYFNSSRSMLKHQDINGGFIVQVFRK